MSEVFDSANQAPATEMDTTKVSPRDKYSQPAELCDDDQLPVDQRIEQLTQWKDEVAAEMAAEAEGMHFADAELEQDSALAREAQQVSKALSKLVDNE